MSTAAGLWREKRRAGEGVAGQNNAKTRNGEYLRARGGPAVLRVTLGVGVRAQEGGFSPAAMALGSGQRMGEEEGSAWRFIDRPASGNRKGSGRDWSLAMCG
jgi:hypothetical protein